MSAHTDREFEQTVQWYPGHMAAAMRRIDDYMKLIDVVVEVVDARIPQTGRNPALLRMAAHRPRLLVMGREDLADAARSLRWVSRDEAAGERVALFSKRSRADTTRLRATVRAVAGEGAVRAIVLGIPNAGKSTVINALVGRAVARVEDRAGVTRAAQWFRAGERLHVLDTAGLLPPRVDGEEAKWRLALAGAVPRARFDAQGVIAHFAAWASDRGLEVPNLETFAQRRGFIRRGTMLDVENASGAYLKEFADGKLGRFTLDDPP